MLTAAMACFVVMVSAVDVRVKNQLAGQIVGHGAVGCAGKAAEQLDASLHQGNLRTGTDAAAEDDVCALLDEEAYQSTMALAVGGNDLGAQELAVFGLVELELGRAAKVMEDLAVFIGNCDFHNASPL